MKIVIFGDMHLSDMPSTPQEALLDWAVNEINEINPDVCVCIGDVTACGSLDACIRYMDKIGGLSCSVLNVCGNSDIRNPDTAPIIRDLLRSAPDGALCGEYRIVGIDTSAGSISGEEKQRLSRISEKETLLLVSHFSPSDLDRDSSSFLENYINYRKTKNQKIILFASGHTHLFEKNNFHGVETVTVRALDPDKNIGGFPHLLAVDIDGENITYSEHLFENNLLSQWSADEINEFADFLGITCYDIPRDMRFAIENKVRHIEWRRADEEYLPLLEEWRRAGGKTFSVHMPSLGFADGNVTGAEKYIRLVNQAIKAGADMITVHPPAVPNSLMLRDGEAFAPLADTMAAILRPAAESGILIVFENNHTVSGTCKAVFEREFGCTPSELQLWRNAIEERTERNISRFRLDIGHARNNVPVSQEFTLGKWYSLIGSECGAYHLHQTTMDENGVMHNHHPINSLHERLISLDGFMWSWHTGLLEHSPMILEIREGVGASATWLRLHKILKGEER